MSLSKGDRLGPYEIAGELGRGGMGEVYRARDTRLGREVAIKVLPTGMAADPAAVARFDQEARAVAALSHPNILAIHDIGQHEGVAFAVAELLDGETLRDRLNAGRMPIRKAVDLGLQVAQGLAAAHSKGIVHRDIKPENIFITADGHAKILDFGLAKVQSHAPSDLTTAVASHTDPGTVLGTTGYLSPEQAQAKPIDARSDIFSFGAVLYEMLTGRRAFKGDSTIDTLHSIVHDQPAPVDTAAPDVPGELKWLLDKCLAKDPDERYQSTRDLVVDLKAVTRSLDSSPKMPVTPVAPLRATDSSRNMVLGGAIVVAAIAIGAAIIWRPAASRPVAESTAPKIQIERVTSMGTVIDAAISPDGKYVAYATSENARQGLSVRQLATGSTIELVPPLSGGMWGAMFSPDGGSVYYGLFTADEPTKAIYRVPILGGTPKKLVTGIDCQPTFSPDGKQMVWLRGDFPGRGESALMMADIDGQHVRTVATRKPPEYLVPIFFTLAAWSPDGSRIVVPLWNSETRTGTLVAYRPDGTEAPFPKYEWPSVGQANWMPDGSGLIVVAGTGNASVTRRNQLWFVSADHQEQRQITNDFLDYRRGQPTADGSTLIAVTGEATSTIWTAPIDGSETAVRVASARQDGISGVAALADGRIVYRSLEGGTPGLWIMNADGSRRTELTGGEGVASWPAPTPDGHSILYARDSGLWRIGADGTGSAPVKGGEGGSFPQITPDGKTIVFTGGNAATNQGVESLFSLPIEGGTAKSLLDINVITGLRAAISPDGKQMAYYFRDRGDATYLGVMPMDGTRPTQKYNVAPSIAYALVRWTADGKALLHNSGINDRANIWLQPLDGGKPRAVTHFSDQVIFAFDRAPDGKRLLIARGTLTRDAMLIRNFH